MNAFTSTASGLIEYLVELELSVTCTQGFAEAELQVELEAKPRKSLVED